MLNVDMSTEVESALTECEQGYALILADRASIGSEAALALTESLRGKPVIARLLEKCCDRRKVTIVLDSDNAHLRHFLNKYAVGVRQVFAADNGGALQSLLAGLSALQQGGGGAAMVLCAHVLCNEIDPSVHLKEDALIARVAEGWRVKGYAHAYLVEQGAAGGSLQIGSGSYVSVGCYQFADVALLRQLLEQAAQVGECTVERAIDAYRRRRGLRCVVADEVFDLASDEGRTRAADYFFNARSFNKITVNREAGVIIKESTKTQKLEDEYEWYINLPGELQSWVPKQYSFVRNDADGQETATLTMELCDYPPLSELFISGKLPCGTWKRILRRLFEVHRMLEAHSGQLGADDIQMLYLHKTLHRIVELLKSDRYWKRLWTHPKLILNGVAYKNIRHFEAPISAAIDELIASAPITIVHGDYCFSNILFDVDSLCCKLIDPRGSVRDKERTIYGDPRYDIAKLRHSAVGGYDYAVHGLFNLQDEGNEFVLTDNYPAFQEELTDTFDSLTEEFGFNVRHIQLIEALIFLAIIPLHRDSIDRQKLFYLKAVKKINELFEGK